METIQTLIGTQLGLVLAFAATALMVVAAGIRLSLYGDALGDRTGLGSGIIGLVFLAGVTSLPEVVVSLTSVIQTTDPAKGADLATGNMLGSNVFNLLILAFMALLFPRRFNPQSMEDPQTDSALYGLGMLGLFALSFLFAGIAPLLQVPVLDCSLPVLTLPLAYAWILRREHRMQQKEEKEHLPTETKLAHLPAFHFYGVLALLCALIVGGGVLLSILGGRMALPPEQGGFGLEASLIGTLFLAVSTSLPELVISFASVRMGFLEMSVGNVLGSNMFNLLIIFFADIGLRGHSLLKMVSPKHWTSVGMILVLTLLAGLLLRTRSKRQSIPIAAGMVLLYLAAMAVFI